MARRRVLYVRLDEELDRDIIEWLEGLPSRPAGLRGQAVKEALRRGIRGDDAASTSAAVVLDAAAVREAVAAALAEGLDLTEIRRVVEAAVRSALAGIRADAVLSQEEEEVKEMLDDLGGKIML